MPALPTLDPISSPYAHTHAPDHLLQKRYETSSSSPVGPIFISILIPIFFLFICCCIASCSNKEKTRERKKKELDESIARSVRLHEEILREERESGNGNGNGNGALPDSVVAEIVRSVRREMEMGSVQGVVVREQGNGRRVLVRRRNESILVVDGAEIAGEVRDGEGPVIEEPPPVYKRRG